LVNRQAEEDGINPYTSQPIHNAAQNHTSNVPAVGGLASLKRGSPVSTYWLAGAPFNCTALSAVAAESADNPFVRIWRGVDSTGEEQVTVWGRPATLKLWAPDYDGGHKAWVLFGDSGEEAIVGGSQVERG